MAKGTISCMELTFVQTARRETVRLKDRFASIKILISLITAEPWLADATYASCKAPPKAGIEGSHPVTD